MLGNTVFFLVLFYPKTSKCYKTFDHFCYGTTQLFILKAKMLIKSCWSKIPSESGDMHNCWNTQSGQLNGRQNSFPEWKILLRSLSVRLVSCNLK